MHKGLLFLGMAIVSGLWLASPGHAAPSPLPGIAGAAAAAGTVHKVQIFPRRYYRRNPYAVPPVAPVVPVVPAVPDGTVTQAPIGGDVYVAPLPPPRPASCGEFHFWNGVACVDARFNKPYLGPRP